MLRLCNISCDSCIAYMYLATPIVFHKRHCDFMMSPSIRTALPDRCCIADLPPCRHPPRKVCNIADLPPPPEDLQHCKSSSFHCRSSPGGRSATLQTFPHFRKVPDSYRRVHYKKKNFLSSI